jgi:hypothetical protein
MGPASLGIQAHILHEYFDANEPNILIFHTF